MEPVIVGPGVNIFLVDRKIWLGSENVIRSIFRVLTWNRPIETAISTRVMFWVPGRYLTLDR